MVSVVEQARQNPVNATPLGWDVTEVKYPAVNTCTTVTVCGQKGLVGLHLGLMMGGDLPTRLQSRLPEPPTWLRNARCKVLK